MGSKHTRLAVEQLKISWRCPSQSCSAPLHRLKSGIRALKEPDLLTITGPFNPGANVRPIADASIHQPAMSGLVHNASSGLQWFARYQQAAIQMTGSASMAVPAGIRLQRYQMDSSQLPHDPSIPPTVGLFKRIQGNFQSVQSRLVPVGGFDIGQDNRVPQASNGETFEKWIGHALVPEPLHATSPGYPSPILNPQVSFA